MRNSKIIGFITLTVLMLGMYVNVFGAGSFGEVSVSFKAPKDAHSYAIAAFDENIQLLKKTEVNEQLTKGNYYNSDIEWAEGTAQVVAYGYDSAGSEVFSELVTFSQSDWERIKKYGSFSEESAIPVTVVYNDRVINAKAFIFDETSHVDLRAFYTALGAVISEDDDTITAEYQDYYIEIGKKNNRAMVNSAPIEMSSQIRLAGDSEMLAARDLAAVSELVISWNPDKKVVKMQTQAHLDEKSKQSPYYIHIDKTELVMNIYGLDAFGDYDVCVKTYPIVIGKTSAQTPVGEFSIIGKEEWHKWSSTSYTKYSSKYAPGLYIHTPLFSKPSDDAMREETVSIETSGCVKTSVENCKWIYDNCPIGTVVTIS